MSDLSHMSPTTRFSGLANLYSRCRPSYPASALDFLLEHCSLSVGSWVIDIGCGTGISSRLLAERGLNVIGVEPNAEMRALANKEPRPASEATLEYRDGRAEDTSLPGDSADAVVAAQAFHWFKPEEALREFHRLLRPRGWVILMWNERDESDPFTAAYGAVIRSAPDAAVVEGPRGRAGDPLLVHSLFVHAARHVFTHHQELDEESLLGRAFSASYAPRDPQTAERFAADLREVVARFQQHGRVRLSYETSVYVAQKKVSEPALQPA